MLAVAARADHRLVAPEPDRDLLDALATFEPKSAQRRAVFDHLVSRLEDLSSPAARVSVCQVSRPFACDTAAEIDLARVAVEAASRGDVSSWELTSVMRGVTLPLADRLRAIAAFIARCPVRRIPRRSLRC